MKPEYVREQEANDRVQKRIDEAERRHTLETLGEGRVARRRIGLVAGAVVLAWVIFRVVMLAF